MVTMPSIIRPKGHFEARKRLPSLRMFEVSVIAGIASVATLQLKTTDG